MLSMINLPRTKPDPQTVRILTSHYQKDANRKLIMSQPIGVDAFSSQLEKKLDTIHLGSKANTTPCQAPPSPKNIRSSRKLATNPFLSFVRQKQYTHRHAYIIPQANQLSPLAAYPPSLPTIPKVSINRLYPKKKFLWHLVRVTHIFVSERHQSFLANDHHQPRARQMPHIPSLLLSFFLSRLTIIRLPHYPNSKTSVHVKFTSVPRELFQRDDVDDDDVRDESNLAVFVRRKPV